MAQARRALDPVASARQDATLVCHPDCARGAGKGEAVSAPYERTTGSQSVGRALPYRRLVVALDGSERAERILHKVAMLARQFGAMVTLVRVITPPGPPVPELPEGATWGHRAAPAPTPCADREWGETARYLQVLADRLRADRRKKLPGGSA